MVMTYDIPDTTLVDDYILIKLWNDYIVNHPDLNLTGKRLVRDFYTKHIHKFGYNIFVKEFQDWLWNQGGTVILKDKKQYIQFTDPQQATVFLLRWS
jgi:hypothetical protein